MRRPPHSCSVHCNPRKPDLSPLRAPPKHLSRTFRASGPTRNPAMRGDPTDRSSKDSPLVLTGARLAVSLKPRSPMLIPVLFASFIALITLTPVTDAQATEVKISQVIDYADPASGPILSSEIVERNQKPEVESTKAVQETDAVQEAKGTEFIKDQALMEVLPTELLEADFPTATAVPTSIFNGLSDAAFRARSSPPGSR